MTFLHIDTLLSLRGHLGSLEILHLRLFDYESAVTIFDDAPLLKELKLGEEYDIPQIFLPWQSLTCYSGDSFRLLDALSRTPNLEECIVRVPGSDWPASYVSSPHITLSKLRKFHVQAWRDCDDEVMDHLTLPSLEYLRWNLNYYDPKRSWVPSLLTRSRSMISHLELTHLSKDCDFISQVLQAAPSVTNLTFDAATPDVLRFLIGHEGADATVLPNLQQLTVMSICGDGQMVSDALLKIMESRLHAVEGSSDERPVSLREVALHDTRFTYTATRMSRLLQLQAEGLVFRHVKAKNGVIKYAFTCTLVLLSE
jgi:hypothetical protein